MSEFCVLVRLNSSYSTLLLLLHMDGSHYVDRRTGDVYSNLDPIMLLERLLTGKSFLNFKISHFFDGIFCFFNFYFSIFWPDIFGCSFFGISNFIFEYLYFFIIMNFSIENPFRNVEGTNLGRLRRIRHGNGKRIIARPTIYVKPIAPLYDFQNRFISGVLIRTVHDVSFSDYQEDVWLVTHSTTGWN